MRQLGSISQPILWDKGNGLPYLTYRIYSKQGALPTLYLRIIYKKIYLTSSSFLSLFGQMMLSVVDCRMMYQKAFSPSTLAPCKKNITFSSRIFKLLLLANGKHFFNFSHSLLLAHFINSNKTLKKGLTKDKQTERPNFEIHSSLKSNKGLQQVNFTQRDKILKFIPVSNRKKVFKSVFYIERPNLKIHSGLKSKKGL